jgi:hypothetical protein
MGLGPKSEPPVVASQQVVGDAEDVEAVPAVEVGELGEGEQAVTPGRVRVELAEQQVVVHA